MSVHGPKQDNTISNLPANPICDVCGHHSRYHIEWIGEHTICICSKCASRMKKGFTADLIHISAIEELEREYPQFTLIREYIKQL